MQNLLIKIKELKVINYSRKDNSFDVVANFNVNDKQETLTKRFKMDNRFDALGKELVEYIKKFVKDRNKPDAAADFLEGVVIVRYDDVEEVGLKVSNFFRKFNDHVKGYKTRGYSEGFLNTYRTPDGFSMKIV